MKRSIKLEVFASSDFKKLCTREISKNIKKT